MDLKALGIFFVVLGVVPISWLLSRLLRMSMYKDAPRPRAKGEKAVIRELSEKIRAWGERVASTGKGATRTQSYSSGADESTAEPTPKTESPDGEEGPPEAPVSRQINTWIEERAGEPERPLLAGESYTVRFQVGRPRQGSLTAGPEAAVPDADVPPAGLATEWIVTTMGVELTSTSAEVAVTAPPPGGPPLWTARFRLLIPRDEDSEIRALRVLQRTESDARLCIAIYTGPELYRQLTVRLAVERAAEVRRPLVSLDRDCVHAAEAHLGLRTTHEWTTPPGELSIAILGSMAAVRGGFAGQMVDTVVSWTRDTAGIAGKVRNVRAAAEKLRGRWEGYFDDIDPDDLEARLQSFSPNYDWSQLADWADEAHRRTWEEVAQSAELYDLAAHGYALYQALFPADEELRGWLDGLRPGCRLDVSWLRHVDGAISNIPWGLMYVRPPVPGDPVDPTFFLGLRFRIGYTAHPVRGGSKALGAPARAHRANLLYWGDHPQDLAGIEARRQQQRWSVRVNQTFVPVVSGAAPPKTQALRLLSSPAPSPVAVLYLFCECKVGDGEDPVLSFGGTTADRVRRTEMGFAPLGDQPLVFANACTTAAADPYVANELEGSFFERGCRAFLGTETKVPIALASRFATVFFDLFERRVDQDPMAAGEALAQTRLFLWSHFRNLGGLFYTYVNQYELFLADPEEVVALRA